MSVSGHLRRLPRPGARWRATGVLVAIAAGAVGVAAVAAAQQKDGPINPKGGLKVTKLETFLVQPRWLFLKVHTDAGLIGLGEATISGLWSGETQRGAARFAAGEGRHGTDV